MNTRFRPRWNLEWTQGESGGCFLIGKGLQSSLSFMGMKLKTAVIRAIKWDQWLRIHKWIRILFFHIFLHIFPSAALKKNLTIFFYFLSRPQCCWPLESCPGSQNSPLIIFSDCVTQLQIAESLSICLPNRTKIFISDYVLDISINYMLDVSIIEKR